MGYHTEFRGEIELDRPVDPETAEFMDALAQTRRMKRNVGPEYGEEGEFYIKDDDEGIIDDNHPPGKQPSLWLQWVLTPDRQHLVWDEGENFHEPIGWMIYLRDKVLNPRGYQLVGGSIEWYGGEKWDYGVMEAKENKIIVRYGEGSPIQGGTY